MSASDWPRADPALERFYRRLLHAYPGSYRRRHGAEIVTTLLEMAEPGRRRPRPADVLHLLASGLRQRFRLPAGRPLAWPAAVLALLAAGALGAAGGSWAGVHTFADLPPAEQAQALHRQIAGTAAMGDPVPAGVEAVPMWWTHSSADGTVWDGEQARARLAADGWQVGPLQATDRFETGTGAPEHGFDAFRDGLKATVTGEGGSVAVDLAPDDSGLLLPLIAAGLAVGAVTGWLIAAAVARRRSRPAAAGAAVTFAVLFAPVWSLYDDTVMAFQLHGHPGVSILTVHGRLMPDHVDASGPSWLSWIWPQVTWINAALTGVGVVLAVLTVLLAAAFPAAGSRTVREVTL
ncbi:hypothetical protein [Actinoplanes sichuanensis]|uniref:Uncharacterized protein n=1 Tax=Actinoplanes sichuanensis TaxID=512349 RepID=A0ABW4APY8_9ACTN|nr:hypothetical protein [Actinoplanes sichuanensis]